MSKWLHQIGPTLVHPCLQIHLISHETETLRAERAAGGARADIFRAFPGNGNRAQAFFKLTNYFYFANFGAVMNHSFLEPSKYPV